jgi:uncharacterized coiled-coil protein SlyX
MDWIDLIVAVIAAAGGFCGSVVANNKQVAVLAVKLDGLTAQLRRLEERVDAHNHLNERITALEVKMGSDRHDG